jgi:hypothetical protein
MRAGRSALLVLLVAIGVACRPDGPVLVRLEMPGVSPFPAGAFDEIIVTDFRNEAPLAGLDAGRELRDDLAADVHRAFPGRVSVGTRPAGEDPAPAAWRDAAAGREGAVFLTGTVRLTSQVRKAVQDKDVPDGPFKMAGRVLIEQVRWTLAVDLAVISARTGEPVFRKDYRETRDYNELDKPAEFALSDLAAVFRSRLLPTLLATPTIEPRTLLRR